MDLPLLENDLDAPSIVDPSAVVGTRSTTMPACAVFCFFTEVLEAIAADSSTRRLKTLVAAHGVHPIYAIERNGRPIAVVHAGVGGPLATILMEEAIALGCETAIAVGGAGALLPELVLGHAVVISSAVRDEGTSFHYLAPSPTVDADPAAIRALEQTLAAADVPYLSGATWTTDAPYRETRTRMERRVAEGCLVVEMEAAAFIAVARYRGIRFGQLVYAGDSLAGPEWQERGWSAATSVREAMFWLAVDACLELHAS